MRTRSQARRRRQPQVRQTSVESSNLEKPDNPPIVTMADNRTMAQLLEAPTEGYEDAIVIPEITANNFEIKHGLLNLVQNKQFFGNDKEDPHAHIRYFNKITSTMKIPNVPNTSVKLMLFPFSLEGAARIWLEKEPPRSIETWDDLVSKFINKFFPPSKTTNLRNEITRFQQKFDETFYEAWDRFNDLLRGCPHHGFSELHQLDTFYNALNSNDQDSLNSAAGGNFLDKMPRECLKIIESKSKVRQSRNKAVVAKMSTSSSTPAISSDVAELKDMVRALILDRKNQTPASAPLPLAAIFNQANFGYRTSDGLNQIRPPGFLLIQYPPAKYFYSGSGTLPGHDGPQLITEASEDGFLQHRFHFTRINDERRKEKANDQIEKFYEIFRDLSFEISFTDALMLMPKFASTLKTLIGNKEKLSELARTPLNENCSAGSHHAPVDKLQTYTADYNHMTVSTKSTFIDMACVENSQEVLGFSNVDREFVLALEDDQLILKLIQLIRDPYGGGTSCF
ncbi:reverse transcriptase domain-containing protein [Tanacetum coccineum]